MAAQDSRIGSGRVAHRLGYNLSLTESFSMEETRGTISTASPASAAPPAVETHVSASPAPPLWGQILRVAWLSIGLGLLLELVLLVLAAYTDTAGDSPKPFVADLAQKVSWGFIVCVGIAFGSTAGKVREAAMGILGLLSAPAGFAIARAIHKGVGAALGLAGPAAAGAFPFVIAGLKGLEYGLLGAAIGWVGKKAWGLGAHVLTGILIGLTFGGAILWALAAASPGPDPLVTLLSRGVNELLFPVGCSLVLYASGALARRLPGT
jgi:hypothetical protein